MLHFCYPLNKWKIEYNLENNILLRILSRIGGTKGALFLPIFASLSRLKHFSRWAYARRQPLSGELERSRDWIKNQMHIWQGRYVIGQLLDRPDTLLFWGGLHTRVDGRLRSKIFLSWHFDRRKFENIRKKKKEKRKGTPRKPRLLWYLRRFFIIRANTRVLPLFPRSFEFWDTDDIPLKGVLIGLSLFKAFRTIFYKKKKNKEKKTDRHELEFFLERETNFWKNPEDCVFYDLAIIKSRRFMYTLKISSNSIQKQKERRMIEYFALRKIIYLYMMKN